ncbi:MAG: hypothetical protein ACRELY_04560, partial [Polyangiaceae bacterium]
MDADFVDYLLAWIVAMPVTYAILRFDESRLSEERLEHAWPPTSRNAAILAFGPLCLFVHFVRTRRSFFIGLFFGVAAFVLVGVVHAASAWVV